MNQRETTVEIIKIFQNLNIQEDWLTERNANMLIFSNTIYVP
jgi:hypothetical protein